MVTNVCLVEMGGEPNCTPNMELSTPRELTGQTLADGVRIFYGGPPDSANSHPSVIPSRQQSALDPVFTSLLRFSIVLPTVGPNRSQRAVVSLATLGVGGLTPLQDVSIFAGVGWPQQSLDRRT